MWYMGFMYNWLHPKQWGTSFRCLGTVSLPFLSIGWILFLLNPYWGLYDWSQRFLFSFVILVYCCGGVPWHIYDQQTRCFLCFTFLNIEIIEGKLPTPMASVQRSEHKPILNSFLDIFFFPILSLLLLACFMYNWREHYECLPGGTVYKSALLYPYVNDQLYFIPLYDSCFFHSTCECGC